MSHLQRRKLKLENVKDQKKKEKENVKDQTDDEMISNMELKRRRHIYGSITNIILLVNQQIFSEYLSGQDFRIRQATRQSVSFTLTEDNNF